jgi:hypothetical protein
MGKGWAAVKDTGTWVTGCFSFKNTSTLTVTRIRFTMLLENRTGDVAMKVPFDREGTFSSNIDIRGYGSLSDLFDRSGHRGKVDNCWGKRVDDENEIAELKRVHYFNYNVRRVEFSDGTAWQEKAEPAR